ncbi:MAG: tetratricopeptide repeat protein [Candidatus Sumerlaeia bacterium]
MSTTKKWMHFIMIGVLLLGLIGCGSKTPEELLDAAYQDAQRGDMVGVGFKCEKIIKADPESEIAQEARFLWANALAQTGEVPEARKKWQTIVDKGEYSSPLIQNAVVNIVNSYVAEEDYTTAINTVKDVIEKTEAYPDFQTQAKFQLASLYMISEQNELAHSYLTQLLESAESHQEKQEVLGMLVDLLKNQDRLPEAIELYRDYIDSMDESVEETEKFAAMRVLGGLLVQEKKYEEAAQLYQDQIDNQPESDMLPILYWGVGSIMATAANNVEDAGKKSEFEKRSDAAYEKAISLTQQALDEEVIEAQKIHHVNRISNIYKEQGKYDKAVETLENYLEANPEDVNVKRTVLPLISEIYFLQKDFEKAKEALQRLADAMPGTQDAQQATQYIQMIDEAAQRDAIMQEQIEKEKTEATPENQGAPLGPTEPTPTLPVEGNPAKPVPDAAITPMQTE